MMENTNRSVLLIIVIGIAVLGISSGVGHQQNIDVPRLSKFEEMYRRQLDVLKDMFDDSRFENQFKRKGVVELASVPLGAVIFSDHGDRYQLAAQIPRVRPEDIQIEFKDHFLTVKIERNEEKADEKGNWAFVSQSSWMKSIKLDDEIRYEDISASLGDEDILQIQIFKPKEKQEIDRVKIPIVSGKKG
jgi:HSP20 family molecular chaperone IbpA